MCLIPLVIACLLPATASAQSARARYERAMARERSVRAQIEKADTTGERTRVLRDAERAVDAYEALVRRYPTSGYCDNALWHMAELHRTLVEELSRDESRERAVHAYQWLIDEYPHSSLVKKARTSIADMERAREARKTERAAAAETERRRATPAAPPASERSALVTLTGIERSVLPEAVRVTLFLDQEVPYHAERITGPDRVFFDLKGVVTPPSLRDAALDYGDDVVRQIRVGRHPDSTVRVVLDIEGVARYSVFTLYHPFRLVVDCERTPAAAAAARRAALETGHTATDAPAPAIPPVTAPSAISDAVPAARWEVDRVAPDAGPEPEPEPGGGVPVPSKRTAATVTVPPAPPVANSAGGFSIARQLGLGVSRIVIDPGHGGRDPGTIRRGLKEADLTLDIALRLEKLLKEEAGVDVVLTRRTDVYIPLEERTAIANRENADLFLSIHLNSSRNTKASGVETYYLSFASSPDAEAVAARENTGSDSAMHNLPDIIKAIALNNKLDESRDLASMVQESLVGRLGRVNRSLRDRGVKKAPFVVLIGAGMPSVLAEVSFLTHRQDQRLLNTTSYRQRAAEALKEAVLRYRRALKGTAKAATQ